MRRARPVVGLLLLLAFTLSGCRLGVRTEVTVERDGSGAIAVAVALDEALLEALDDLAVDPTAELTAAVASAPDWQLARTATDAGGLTLTLRRDADDPAELTDALRELTDGLTDTDPALAVDLDLEVDDEGAAQLDGTVQLRTPIGPGLLTDEVTEADLAELAARTVDAALVVTLPGPVTDHDADEIDGSTLTWRVAPGDPRPVTAASAAPEGLTPEQVAALVGGALVLVGLAAVTVVVVRRRSR